MRPDRRAISRHRRLINYSSIEIQLCRFVITTQVAVLTSSAVGDIKSRVASAMNIVSELVKISVNRAAFLG